MTVFTALPFAAAALSLLLGVASVLRKKPTLASWLFFAGMAVFALDSLFTGFSLLTESPADTARWLTLGLVVKSLVPATWLGFSLIYSRGDYRDTLARWKLPLAILALLPLGLALVFRSQLLEVVLAGPDASALQLRSGAVARILNALLLMTVALALMNLEQTIRAAVGMARWRVKFVVLGLSVIFAGYLYVRSQAILYSAYDVALAGVESSALIVGCLLLALAYARTEFAEADVYPSRAVVRSSLTAIIVGGYLFVVGVLAQLVRRFGGAESFQLQAFVVLLGMAGLAALLLSDRLRQWVHGFVGRHFGKAHYDSVRIWTSFSRALGQVKAEAELWASSAKFVSETFEVLSVNVWLLYQGKATMVGGTVASRQTGPAAGANPTVMVSEMIEAGLPARLAPFDLEAVKEDWAEELRRLNPATFLAKGGNRWCVPLAAGERCLGVLVLGDRVGGAAYTGEELELLRCIADQITSVLLNLRLADEVAHAKELEAFRTMSAFFVHDLKNAAASLNLTLKNLPVHFDNPAFREDALRAVGNTASRIDEIIERLSALRQRPDVRPADIDLNQVVGETIDSLAELRGVALTRELQPVPRVLADREQFRSVFTNLLLNARDALGPDGRIDVRTEQRGGRVVVVVADNGCGMSASFIRDSLFRPFQSTKKNGLGIGMFQSQMIVEAHGGSILVESQPGGGTMFRVSLPAKVEP